VRGHLFLLDGTANPEATWIDVVQYWRTDAFAIITGMTMTIQYENVTVTLWQGIMRNVLQLFPLYWIGLFSLVPIKYLPDYKCQPGPTSRNFLIELAAGSGLISVDEYTGMHHGWYLTAHILYVLCFNPVQRFVKHRLATSQNSCSELLRLAAFVSGIYVIGFLCCTMYGTDFISPMTPLTPYLQPLLGSAHRTSLTLCVFVLGMLVGQACLKISLDVRQAKIIALVSDLVVVAVLVGSLVPGLAGATFVIMYYCPVILAFVIFAMCTTNSYTTCLLSSSPLSLLGEFSYAIYIFHIPVIDWSFFAFCQDLNSWSIAKFDYSTLDCASVLACERLFQVHRSDALQIYAIVILLSMVLTWGVHNPCQNALNRLSKHVASGAPI